MAHLKYCLLLVVLCLPMLALAQYDYLLLPSWDGSGRYLNELIVADTLPGRAIPPNRVYLLSPDSIYLWNRTFTPGRTGDTMRFWANGTGTFKPTIYLAPQGTGTTPWRPPGYMIQLSSGTSQVLDFKNICLSGYQEGVDTNLYNMQGSLIRNTSAGANASFIFDGCVIKSTNGNHLRTEGVMHKVIVTNSVIADMGFLGTSNLGAGKAIDLRNVRVDTCIFTNNTFVNWQDRIIRHYWSTAPIKYLDFSNNTLINGMSYHGLLSLGVLDSLGGTGHSINIKNNLLIDPYSLGDDTDNVRQSEMTDNFESEVIGSKNYNRFTWILAWKNSVAGLNEMDISNNYYAVSDTGRAFLNKYPYAKSEGKPLPYHMNARLNTLGKDTLQAFKRVAILAVNTPKVMSVENRWYYTLDTLNGGGKGKSTWGFARNPAAPPPPMYLYDYDRQYAEYYMGTLNANVYSNVNLTGIGASQWSYLGAPSAGLSNANGSITTSIALAQGWNLVSVPREPADYAASALFSGKAGSMYGYNQTTGGYDAAVTLAAPNGYWVNYPAAGTAVISGGAFGPLQVTATASGWILIGGRNSVVQKADITVSAGVIAGSIYAYNTTTGGYDAVTTIQPGQAVWANVTSPCVITIP